MARPRKQQNRALVSSTVVVKRNNPNVFARIQESTITREDRVARKEQVQQNKFDSKWEEIINATKSL